VPSAHGHALLSKGFPCVTPQKEKVLGGFEIYSKSMITALNPRDSSEESWFRLLTTRKVRLPAVCGTVAETDIGFRSS